MGERATSRARSAVGAGAWVLGGAVVLSGVLGYALVGARPAARGEERRAAAVEPAGALVLDELVGAEEGPSAPEHAQAAPSRTLAPLQVEAVRRLAGSAAEARDLEQLASERALLARRLGADARAALLAVGADRALGEEERLAALALGAELTRGEPPALEPAALELLRATFRAAAYRREPDGQAALAAHALGRLGGAPGEAELLAVLEGARDADEASLALSGLAASQRGELCYELAWRSARGGADARGAQPWLAALAQQVRAAGLELDPSARDEAARVARDSLARAAEPATARTALALLAAADPRAAEAYAFAGLDQGPAASAGGELVELALESGARPERLAERLRSGSDEGRARAAQALLRSAERSSAGPGALAEAQALLVRRAREAQEGVERRRALEALGSGADERVLPWLEELAREARDPAERGAATRALESVRARAPR